MEKTSVRYNPLIYLSFVSRSLARVALLMDKIAKTTDSKKKKKLMKKKKQEASGCGVS